MIFLNTLAVIRNRILRLQTESGRKKVFGCVDTHLQADILMYITVGSALTLRTVTPGKRTCVGIILSGKT